MGIIIKHKKHYFTKIPLWILGFIVFGLAPFIIGMLGAAYLQYTTGESCNEANCSWAVLPWFCFFTIPISSFLFIIFMVIVVVDSIKLSKQDSSTP